MDIQHVAIIMDGNRRWAKSHRLPILRGHRHAAYDVIEPIVDTAIEEGIAFITLWAFSTENWRRQKHEVKGLLALFRQTLSEDIDKLHQKGVRLKVIGDIQRFPADIQRKISDGLEKTKDNSKITVCLALNYGGRDEIIRAINKYINYLSINDLRFKKKDVRGVEMNNESRIMNGEVGIKNNESGIMNPSTTLRINNDLKNSRDKQFNSAMPGETGLRKGKQFNPTTFRSNRDFVGVNNLTVEQFNNYLDTAGMPDPDLIIRTGGEQRLSGFLLWQSEYSELFFTDVLFPDFTPVEFRKIIDDFHKRKRNFGK